MDANKQRRMEKQIGHDVSRQQQAIMARDNGSSNQSAVDRFRKRADQEVRKFRSTPEVDAFERAVRKTAGRMKRTGREQLDRVKSAVKRTYRSYSR